MKDLAVKQLDETEEEIVDILISLGLSRPVAIVLAHLRRVNEVTSSELEAVTKLRQPEVSVAAKQLLERDWINEREEKKPGKGRPFNIYSLKIGFDDIVAQLEEQQRKAIDEAGANVRRLRDLINR